MFINLLRVGVKRMGPNSFQWCPVTAQEATDTHWSIGSSTWTWGRTSSLWGWWSTGTGCQRGCGVSFSGDIKNPPSHGPVQLALGESPLARGWTRWSPEVPSNPYCSAILWFCEQHTAAGACSGWPQTAMQIFAFPTWQKVAVGAMVPECYRGGHTPGKVLGRPNSFHAPCRAVSRCQHLSMVFALGCFI